MSGFDRERAERGDLEVLDTEASLKEAIDRLAAGTGPIAVDTERASGYRYSDRAYLVQLYRRDAGTALIDPIPFEDLRDLGAALADEEWILHAATQDLPSLRQIGLDPSRIFDTELAARLLGKPRVGLGAIVEEVLGIELAKAHSADDWSQRPLPVNWLAYAALDVELLVDVRDALAEELERTQKREWAEEEFADILQRDLGTDLDDQTRWRRLKGLGALRRPRQLAIARELWLARDAYARETDTAPGRLFPDRSLLAVAKAAPTSRGQLAGLSEFHGRQSRSQLDRWWAAVDRARTSTDLPQREVTDPDSPPPVRDWARRDPDADARLQAARPAIGALADLLEVPAENLLTPSLLRRVCWAPNGFDEAAIAAQLRELGAREWQISRTAGVISSAFVGAVQEDTTP